MWKLFLVGSNPAVSTKHKSNTMLETIIKGLTYFMTLFGMICVFVLIGGIFFSWLWNYCMPVLFGLPEITYLQAVALLTVARMILPNPEVKIKK